MLGGPKFSDVATQANLLGRQQEATQSIQEYKKNDGLDFSSMSAEDRKDPEKVRIFATKELARRGFADQGVTAEGSTLAEINKSGKVGVQEIADEVLEGSLSWQTQRQDLADSIARDTARTKRSDLVSDRNFDLQKQTAENQTATQLAALNASIAQAKMQNEQANLDRDYLDRRDMRDYEYRIKKDDMESMDKIFAMLLGGVKSAFI